MKLERDLIALCATAIEDELQDEVIETVHSLLAADMKLIIISGDKP
jgi:phospholipid-translocating ATPase